MKDLWNDICVDLSACKSRNVLEKEYENTIVQCLAILGWRKSLGEIATQYPIQVGHETKRADIVVSSSNIVQFVVEVKRPGHVICMEDEGQMSSYMLQLKCAFGLYIGDDIRLYYDDRSSQSFPEPLFVIDITKDNPDGVRFVELFAKESFNIEKLQEFCFQKKNELEKHKEIQQEIDRLLTDNEGHFLQQLYREWCAAKGVDKSFAEKVLRSITFSIRSKEIPAIIRNTPRPATTSTAEIRKNHIEEYSNEAVKRHWHYTFDGLACTNAGRLAFEIVKRFVKDNPLLTYSEILLKLPRCARIITKEQYLIKKATSNDPDFDKRWSTKFAPMITSSDNVDFATHTGWNHWGYGDKRPYNICDLIEFARKQGYKVEEV